jgi:hypothetical protein
MKRPGKTAKNVNKVEWEVEKGNKKYISVQQRSSETSSYKYLHKFFLLGIHVVFNSRSQLPLGLQGRGSFRPSAPANIRPLLSVHCPCKGD